MKKKRKPIKAKWEWINTPDAEERLQAAFDVIFSKVEEPHANNLLAPAHFDSEAQ